MDARVPELTLPDVCVVDLDPSREDADVLRAAVLGVRDLLEELGLPSWVKTSGSKGFHIIVPLDGKATFDEVGRFTYGVAQLLVLRDPEHLTLEFLKADRGDRILVDVGRNAYGATYAAPYAVRMRPGAPISAPCSWKKWSETKSRRRRSRCGRWRNDSRHTGISGRGSAAIGVPCGIPWTVETSAR